MKKLTLILSLAGTVFLGCKKSDQEPDGPKLPIKSTDGSITGTVTINGTIYPTVVIGSDTWTSVNYNGLGGLYYKSGIDPKYGKLYTLKEAQSIILPEGWRLPSESDFTKLMNNYDGTYGFESVWTSNETSTFNLMSKQDWKGNNNINDCNLSGFNAYPAGWYNVDFSYFVQLGYETAFWSLPYSRPFFIRAVVNSPNAGRYTFSRGFSATRPESRYSIRFVRSNSL